MTKLDLAHLAEVAGKAIAALGKRDRPTTQPGGCDCHECGCIFIGSDAHTLCADCHATREFRGSLTPTVVLALLDRLREAEEAWQPIETAPRPEEYQPMVCVLLSWTDVSQEGEVRQTVGEGYWRAEGAGGDWWWANLGPGDYHADPIAEMITGQITHWRPLPAPPFTPEGPALPGRGEG